MDNLEYLKKVKEFDEANDMFHKLGAEEFLIYRRAKALEIIAETLIALIVPLENIETILNRK